MFVLFWQEITRSFWHLVPLWVLWQYQSLQQALVPVHLCDPRCLWRCGVVTVCLLYHRQALLPHQMTWHVNNAIIVNYPGIQTSAAAPETARLLSKTRFILEASLMFLIQFDLGCKNNVPFFRMWLDLIEFSIITQKILFFPLKYLEWHFHRVCLKRTHGCAGDETGSLTYSPVIPAGIHFAEGCCRTLRRVQEQRKYSQDDEEWPQWSAAPWEASAHSAHVPGAGCQVLKSASPREQISSVVQL